MLKFLVLMMSAQAAAEKYPLPTPPKDRSAYGRHFQRSMTLMATSTPEKRNTVRILYYGQSIVGQRWSVDVDTWLRKTYPNTEFITENRAIGGFNSQLLVRTMHYDVFPFYPDLIVFHVYGAHDKYEEIIREFRRRTTAEVIIQTDHANVWPEPKAEGNFWQTQRDWGDKMNYHLLPAIAKKYGCALQPQRWEWVEYLKDNSLEPKALLTDSVHLNDHGKWLMAELLKRFLVHLPDAPRNEWEGLVRTVEVGKDVKWEGDRLTLEFDGNRVVALAGPGEAGRAEVRIDGKKPRKFPECTSFTRPGGTAGVGWPAIKRIAWKTPPVLEEWTATFRGFSDDQTDFEFEVEGSVTGPDGKGRGAEPFVSKSGRIVLEPSDWVFEYCKRVSKKPTPDGWKVKWKVIPLFTEVYEPAAVKDASREWPTVLASGLTNGKHVLTLISKGGQRPPLRSIRIYRPPVE